jgi:hypothetical protein
MKQKAFPLHFFQNLFNGFSNCPLSPPQPDEVQENKTERQYADRSSSYVFCLELLR